jgi:hypothetical protein
MKFFLFFLLFVTLKISACEIPDFDNLSKTRKAVFFLSTPKSGSNLISSCLSAITRKPVSWLYWGYEVFEPSSERTQHPSYNRLNLPLVTDIPLLYRTHYEFDELIQINSRVNKLIFVTRNPKELLFRKFYLTHQRGELPDDSFTTNFLDLYLKVFKIFDSWIERNRRIVYYEDYIQNDDQILLDLLQFIDETPTYLDDFLQNKQLYLSRILTSYSSQHSHNSGGASSINGPRAIYYSMDVPRTVLKEIDNYLEKQAPTIWKTYLKRFETH